MSDKGQEDTDAEYGERLLSAHDQGIEYLPLEPGPILGQEADNEDNDDDEMHETVGSEVGLVVRVDSGIKPVREQRAEVRNFSGHGHHQRKQQIGDAQIERDAGIDQPARSPGSAE